MSLGISEISSFLSFPFIVKLSYSKPFYSTLNYASTANIQEGMKFYNLGHKTFETGFNLPRPFCVAHAHLKRYEHIAKFCINLLLMLNVHLCGKFGSIKMNNFV